MLSSLHDRIQNLWCMQIDPAIYLSVLVDACCHGAFIICPLLFNINISSLNISHVMSSIFGVFLVTVVQGYIPVCIYEAYIDRSIIGLYSQNILILVSCYCLIKCCF